jgi:peptidoglycan/LPS O-acetylase OafA/YrhL
MQSRIGSLDIARVLAVLLVVWAHLVSTGGWAPEIPLVIAPGAQLPIFNGAAFSASRLELFFIHSMDMQAGVGGVFLFFLITGFLMPMMMERYTRLEFLINRLCRIYIPLAGAVVAIACFVALTQHIRFSIPSYIGSFTLAYPFMRVPPVEGPLWTLVVEVIFYSICFAVGRFSFRKLLLIQGVAFALVLLSANLPQGNDWGDVLFLLSYHAKFILIILIGSACYLSEHRTDVSTRGLSIVVAILLAFVAQGIHGAAHGDPERYKNYGAFVWMVGGFFTLRYVADLPVVQRAAQSLRFPSELVYSLYLLHLPFGLGAMYALRNLFPNPAMLVLVGFAISCSASLILHFLLEQPAIALGRKLVSRLRKPRAMVNADVLAG